MFFYFSLHFRGEVLQKADHSETVLYEDIGELDS